jgi:parvulin-like peptidyl-prolyl isomerase
MKPMRIALPLVLVLLGVLVAAGCGSSDQSVPSGSVAVVDGTEISQAELDALLGRAKKSYVSQKRKFPKAGTAEYQSLQTQAVAFLVQRAEYDKEAESLGLTITDKELDARVAEVKKTYFENSEKKLQQQLADQGYTTATFRADIRAQLVSEKLYNSVTKDIKVTDADAKKYYDDNKAQYDVAESRDVRHILVKTRAEADDVVAKLEAGGDFASIAKKVSLDPGSKDNGGKLTITKGQTVAPFDQSAFQLKTGQLSKPIKTEFGYHVIQAVSEIKPAKTTPFEQVKEQIKSQLVETKKNEAIQKWAAETRKSYDGKVSYAAGFAPPPTSTTTSSTTTSG